MAYELSAVHELPVSELPGSTTSLPRATKLKHSSEQADFQHHMAKLSATIEHQKQEVARLQQARNTADLGAEEMKREESATLYRGLQKAASSISKLMASVKMLESASMCYPRVDWKSWWLCTSGTNDIGSERRYSGIPCSHVDTPDSVKALNGVEVDCTTLHSTVLHQRVRGQNIGSTHCTSRHPRFAF